MADTIKLDLVTPIRQVISDEFDSVSASSVEGEFGVLPGHAPLLTLLKAGVVIARRKDKATPIAIYSGFAEVEPDRVIILTEKAATAAEVEVKEVKKKLEDTEEKLKECTDAADSVEFRNLTERKAWLQAQLDITEMKARIG